MNKKENHNVSLFAVAKSAKIVLEALQTHNDLCEAYINRLGKDSAYNSVMLSCNFTDKKSVIRQILNAVVKDANNYKGY